mgnify:CR=1 FL=1
MKRPELDYEKLAEIDPERPDLPAAVREQVNIQIKYDKGLAEVWRQSRQGLYLFVSSAPKQSAVRKCLPANDTRGNRAGTGGYDGAGEKSACPAGKIRHIAGQNRRAPFRPNETGGIVLPQQKPKFRPARHHAVRLLTAFVHKVVNQHADVSVRTL